MSNNIIEKAAHIMESFASDPSVGYDQTYRWGEKGDYDCSTAVITAYERAGVPVKQSGATYTGNMYAVFKKCGFKDVTTEVDLVYGTGLERGDVLLNHRNHTAIYVGGGKTAEASLNELGRTTGGTPGDQTGGEFLIRLYRNYPWDCVLRYTGDTEASNVVINAPTYFYKVDLPLLKKGMESPYVKALQEILKARGFYELEIDGVFGDGLEKAVKTFQDSTGLEPDGEVGGQTWNKALGGR